MSLSERLEAKEIKVRVIGKREATSRILRRPQYFVEIEPLEDGSFSNGGSTIELRSTSEQYEDLQEGEIIFSKIYSIGGDRWYFTTSEAILFGKK